MMALPYWCPADHLSAHDGALMTTDGPRHYQVARMLQDNPELELMLEGHADAREDHPIELSRARAVAIRKWLVAQGVTCALGVLPCGAAYPVASNLTAQGRRHNRRAEVQIRLRGAT